MSAFAELFTTVALALFEATVWLGVVAAKPLRFLFSPSYRKQVRERWGDSRGRQVFELVGGTTVLVLFIFVVGWWTSGIFQRQSPEQLRRAERFYKAEQLLGRAHQEMLARRREPQDHK